MKWPDLYQLAVRFHHRSSQDLPSWYYWSQSRFIVIHL